MRVLHVVAGIAREQGGVALAAIGIARSTRPFGADNTIFATDNREPASSKVHTRISLQDVPTEATGLDIRLFRAQRPYRVVYSSELRRAVRDDVREYELVHIHSLFLYPQFTAQRSARRLGIPYVVSIHGCLDPALRSRSRTVKKAVDIAWQRVMLNRAAGIHFTTSSERDLAADLGYTAPASVIPNGINWHDFQVPHDERQNRASSGRPVVLYLGRLSHVKGLDILIRGFAHLRRQIGDAALIIAGPDDEHMTPGLVELAKMLHVGDAVKFTGLLSPSERLIALGRARVCVLPSRTENFGAAVIEAMASGVPVVISPEVNLAPAITAARAGIVCRRDPSVLADTLARVLSDSAEHARLSKAGRAFSRSYDWGEVAPKMMAFYDSAIGQAAV